MRERGCTIQGKIYIRETQRCALLQINHGLAMEASISTSSSPSFQLFLSLTPLFPPTNSLLKPTPCIPSRVPPRNSMFLVSPLFPPSRTRQYEVPERALPFSFPLRYSFEHDTMRARVYVHECERVHIHRSSPTQANA